MHDRLALGLDGGGSKVDAVLIDETGTVLGFGRGGSVATLYVSREHAAESYRAAIQSAMGDHRPCSLWVAGCIAQEFETAGMGVEDLHIVPASEMSMGFAAALETYGILVLSGTGSFVYGFLESGERVHLDSLGPVLGDHGSGYQIGLMGIRASAASGWSPERRTVLEELVPRALGVQTMRDVYHLAYIEHIGRSEIASAATAVCDAAERGDRIARSIILEAADDIASVVTDVIRTLGIEESSYPMVASGGIAQGSALYWSRVCERVLQVAPGLRPIRPAVKPCVGAALLALKAMGVEWSQELLGRIEDTQQPLLESAGCPPSGKDGKP